MIMEMYLLKSAACLAVLMLFYKLLLERENMHVFKRFFLLAAPVISFVIPAITIPEYVTISSASPSLFTETAISSESQAFPYLEVILGAVYLLGVIFFGSIFLINFITLIRRARINPKIETPAATHVLLNENVIPHTFWSYIYLNRIKFERKEIPQEVLDHELAHVKQKHSADILFLEILQIFLWFLPLIYQLKKAVRLNHEFLADRSVLQKTENVVDYQKILLSFSSGQQNTLVNSINYQSIKKRFTVMKKQTSQKAVLLRTFIVLPLLATLLYSFSDREIVVLTPTADAKEIVQEKATPKMIKEYNELARQFKKNGITSEDVESEPFKRMMYIYGLMTTEQRKSAETLPPPPPPIEVEGKPARGAEKINKAKGQNLPPLPPPVEVVGLPAPPLPPPVEVQGHPADGAKAVQNHENKNSTPLPPPVEVIGYPSPPPPPPPPPSPEEAIQKWMEEGAEFFYNGKAVSGKEALKHVQENNGKNLSVQVEDKGSGKTVRITDHEK